MAKRTTITDFFNVGLLKRPKNDQKIKEDETAIKPINTLSLNDDNKPGCSRSNTQNEIQETAATLIHENTRPKSEDRKSQQKEKCVEWYKENKLDSSWLLKSYDFLSKVKLGNKRSGVKCEICSKHIQEALKFSKNGTLPIADGVRCDGKKELERIVDHFSSEAHKAAVNLNEMENKWAVQSDQHPWVKTLKSYAAEKIKLLIELAVDVYNDSRTMTLSAHSWPSRSLTKIHTDIQISSYKDHGLESEFSPLNPSPALLQYRNPVMYREMLDVVGEVIMEGVVLQLKNSECFSIQVDGSVDKYGVDNKFITARFISEDCEMKSVFLGESKSSLRGAEGLMESVKIVLQDLDLIDTAKDKLTGLTTDGESANTGKYSGLWVRMKEFLGRDLLCIWCVAHRSDLAMSDLESIVVEVQHWKINLKAVGTFYRASALRFGELEKLAESTKQNVYRFPAHFDVRFVEHLNNLAKAVWNNLPLMQQHWSNVLENDDSTKVEKASARGFLRLWETSGEQQRLTSLMLDLLKRMEKLQKDCQRSCVTIPDIEVSKKIFVDSLSLMENDCYPGGYEEKWKKEHAGELESDESEIEDIPRRCRTNLFVSTKRNWLAVRKEVVLSCKEFILQRLSDDQEEICSRINGLLHSKNPIEVLNAVRLDVEGLFGEDKVSDFTDDVVGLFATGKLPASSSMTSSTGRLYHFLKVSQPHSILRKLVQSYISLTPHSAGPERAVSVHTTLKSNKQSGLSREALNSRMRIALNGIGTANFDPRPSVAKFLEKKERRRKLPDSELYRDQEFVKKFFANDSNL